MKWISPRTCFGYKARKEAYFRNGNYETVIVEECSALDVMMCRRATNAKEACRFYKTPEQFRKDQEEAERKNRERKVRSGKTVQDGS